MLPLLLGMIGCAELEGDSSANLKGGQDAKRFSFSAPPGELRTVLADLRAKTGWKLNCDPEMERELVYLKFKDKTEREVVQALGQVLLANYPKKGDAMTLSAAATKQINDIMFKNEIYDIGVRIGASYYRFGGMMKGYIRRVFGDALVDRHLAMKRAADPAMILNRDVIF